MIVIYACGGDKLFTAYQVVHEVVFGSSVWHSSLVLWPPCLTPLDASVPQLHAACALVQQSELLVLTAECWKLAVVSVALSEVVLL